MLLRYRVYQTSNAAKPGMDEKRLERLAQKYCAKKGLNSASELAYTKEQMPDLYVKSLAAGICGGMVCDWALSVILFENAEFSPVDLDRAAELQTHMMTTLLKRNIMGKDDGDRKVHHEKAYAASCLQIKPSLSGIFPDSTQRFHETTARITEKIKLNKVRVYLLSVGMRGGRHALGLTYSNDLCYVLEPNEGLFRFRTINDLKRELNNRLIGIALVNSRGS